MAGYGYGLAQGGRGGLVQHIESFNGALKKLTCDLALLYPEDALIVRAKKRILLAVDLGPEAIVTTVGPYLYTYREQIFAGNDSFFVENGYDAELRQSADAEKAGMVSYIIPKVKEAWAATDPAGRAKYKQVVQNLLDDYIEYLALKLEER